jgi:hypothetical protein
MSATHREISDILKAKDELNVTLKKIRRELDPPSPPAPMPAYTAYRAACAEAAQQAPREWTFKSDPRYTAILEHVTREQGEGYLQVLQEEFPALWPRARAVLERLAPLNDGLGKPKLADFPSIQLVCSPTNLRYLYHALRVWQHAEDLGLRDVAFVELGGGYGGLALYVRALQPFFTPRLLRYTLVDLPEACALQNAYLQCVQVAAHSVPMGVLHPRGYDYEPRFVISCYAFSEFDPETRRWYEERLFPHCQHGIMIWNGEAANGPPLYPFVDAPLTVEPERPLTGPGNKVVLW